MENLFLKNPLQSNSTLSKHYHDKKFSDIILKFKNSQEHIYSAHKIVLTSASLFFYTLLVTNSIIDHN